jgi:hypothetical protein
VGAWGVGIFADDIAADVRDDYRELVGDGLAPADATDRLLEAWAEVLADPESATVVWLALAATQVRVGRLEPRVRDHALEVIDTRSDLHRWADEPKLCSQREGILAKLRTDLTGPQRLPTRIPRPIRSVWPFETGSIVTFVRSDGRRAPFRVVGAFGEHGTRGGRIGIVEPLDWSGDVLPDAATLARLPARPPSDWSAASPAPIGVLVLNQRHLDRWQAIVAGNAPAAFVRNYLSKTDRLDDLLRTRYGL